MVASGAECLNAHWFLSLADAKEKIEDWRKYHNEVRPPRGNRAKPPDLLAQSRWCIQPRRREKSGKTLTSGGPRMGTRP